MRTYSKTLTKRINNVCSAMDRMPLVELLKVWKEIDKIPCRDTGIAEIRGMIMNALEKRNQEAFDKWIDSCEDFPDRFFVNN